MLYIDIWTDGWTYVQTNRETDTNRQFDMFNVYFMDRSPCKPIKQDITSKN